MKREFNQNIVILLVINVLVKPLYLFGVETRIQNLVGIDAYGYYFAVLDFVFLFLVINDPGLQNYNAKFVAQHRDAAPAYFRKLLGSKIILGVGFTIATVLIGILIGYPASWLLLGLLAFYWLTSLFVILRGTMAGLGSYKTDSWLSSIDKLLMLLVIGSIVWISSYQSSFTMTHYVWLQVACSFVAILVFALMLRNKGLSLVPKINFRFTKSLVSKSIPFALIIMLTSIFTRIDGVMLERMLPDGPTQAGAYAASYRFIDAGNMIGFLFGGLLLSMYSRLVSTKDSVQALFETSYAQLLIIGSTISAICIFYSEDLFGILYSTEFHAHFPILQILMISFVPVTLTHCMGSLIQAVGSLRPLNYLLGIAVVFNIVTNYLVIPTHQAMGAAGTSVLTQFFILLGMIAIVLQSKAIQPQLSQVMKTLTYTFASFAGVYLLAQSDISPILGIILSGLLCLVLGAIHFGNKIWSKTT